ncbi:MAG: hypothetical protein WC242_01270 [Candidatus Paceibacterota bacterium]
MKVEKRCVEVTLISGDTKTGAIIADDYLEIDCSVTGEPTGESTYTVGDVKIRTPCRNLDEKKAALAQKLSNLFRGSSYHCEVCPELSHMRVASHQFFSGNMPGIEGLLGKIREEGILIEGDLTPHVKELDI